MSPCYLIHFLQPISEKHTTLHYLGYAENLRTLETRIAHHRKGTSKVRLLEVAKERGIDFIVAKVWEDGDREFERKLKRQNNAPRLCPICTNSKEKK